MSDDQDLEKSLEIVRRGFDPAQVQRLVGSLSSTLKALTADNETLRNRLAELEQRDAAPTAPVPADDVISVWSRETTELLDAARQNVARVMERATADGEALIARAEAEAAAIREKADADADRRAAQAIAAAEASAAQVIAAADAHRAQAEADAQMAATAGAANLDQLTAQLADTKRQLAELEAARRVLRDQLRGARTQLEALVTLADETPTQTEEQANEQR